MRVACTQLRSLPRDRDNYTGGTPNPMTSASDGTLEERRYYCQNWRADVVAVTKSDGTPLEYVRYSSYGEPTVYPVADLNMDGVVNSTDSSLWSDLLYSSSNSSVYADTDLDWDGADDWNSSGIDSDLFYESYNANTGLSGVGRVSSAGVGNRVGYAGYQWDQTISACHVRYRVYMPDIGRWTRRDPLGYVDGMGLYEYVQSHSLLSNDPLGLVGSTAHPHAWIIALITNFRGSEPALIAYLFARGVSPAVLQALGYVTLAGAVAALIEASAADWVGLRERVLQAIRARIDRLIKLAGQAAACSQLQSMSDMACKGSNSPTHRSCNDLDNKELQNNCEELSRRAHQNAECIAMRTLKIEYCGASYKDRLDKDIDLGAKCALRAAECFARRRAEEQGEGKAGCGS